MEVKVLNFIFKTHNHNGSIPTAGTALLSHFRWNQMGWNGFICSKHQGNICLTPLGFAFCIKAFQWQAFIFHAIPFGDGIFKIHASEKSNTFTGKDGMLPMN